MIDSLAKLKTGLARTFTKGPKAPETWSNEAEMVRARKRVYQDHGGAGISADPRSIMAAIAQFSKTGKIEGFRDLKYICLGIGSVDEEGWSVLADENLRTAVARMVEQQTSTHRRLRCFQAMLSSYFSFRKNSKDASEESKFGWQGLRAWLRAERDRITKIIEFKPPWYEALLRHPELLTNQPCDKFGVELLKGDASGLNDARNGLSIPEDSWVIDEAVFAQMKAGYDLRDPEFKAVLPDLLQISMGRVGVNVTLGLRIRCIALLVSRYARCNDRPEQPALRDAATSTIGNPWLQRTKWDAHVRVGNKADDQAREMVFFWLKERLVLDFFELLSADGINERRRVAYWLRFVPFVEDMWFALGTSATSRGGVEFGEFRERAKGRLLYLEGTTADNNAFVMRIGPYLAIEFGAGGNAFFLYEWESLSPELLAALNSGKTRQFVHIAELKRDNHIEKLRHGDSPTALKSWEQKFDDKLTMLIGKKPEERPACVPDLEKILKNTEFKVVDNREAGGVLWVYETERSSPLARKLQNLGFLFRSGRGWYKE